MDNVAYKIAIIERSEDTTENRIDNWMVCLTELDALYFKKEFNRGSICASEPGWTIFAEGEPEEIELSESQMQELKRSNRAWLSNLKNK